MAPESSSQSPVVLRRLNGRPQACDPCRNRKVACDHGYPVCKRCSKRGQDKDCVYIISDVRRKPTSKATPALRNLRRPGGRLVSHRNGSAPTPGEAGTLSGTYDSSSNHTLIQHAEYSQQSTATASRLSPILSQQASSDRGLSTPSVDQDALSLTTGATLAGQLPSGRASTPIGPDSGYLGFTSHSSVLEETKTSLSLLQGFQALLPQNGNFKGAMGSVEVPRLLCTPTREMCLVVLRGIPDPSIGPIQFFDSAHPFHGWIRVVTEKVLTSLNGRFGHYLGSCRIDSQLEEIAYFLSENTTKPFSENEPDPEKWMGQFTGSNLRWEAIGFLFFYAELSQSIPDSFSRSIDTDRPKNEALEVCRVCLGLCIDLSRRFSSSNSLLAFLYFRRGIVESLYAGDASLSVWRSGAESVAIATFLGLPMESNMPSYKPTLASECRRRLFALIFTMDKGYVLFTGRPPSLSHRYASTPLPLDLRDEDLMADEQTLQRAVDALDANGWNTAGYLTKTTTLRARLIFAFLRDELIEVALSHRKQAPIEDLLNLRSRQLSSIRDFPPCLIYQPSELMDANILPSIAYNKLLVQLEHLSNMFLVERLILKAGGSDRTNLLATSIELVSLTLLVWTRKDRLANFRRDFEWLVMAYAAPGGGILCMELLHPSFTGNHPTNSLITRSSIIQQLSLLVGFLEWVDPSGPDGDLCANSGAIIKHALDHVLNSSSGNTSWPPQELDDIQLDFNFELFDIFELLRQDTLSNS